MNMNPILAIDGYKVSHREQYPAGTTKVYSNFTPRSDRHFHSCRGRQAGVLRPAGIPAMVPGRSV